MVLTSDSTHNYWNSNYKQCVAKNQGELFGSERVKVQVFQTKSTWWQLLWNKCALSRYIAQLKWRKNASLCIKKFLQFLPLC